MFVHFVLQRQGGKIWQNHGQQNDFSLFLFLVDEQGGFEAPSKEAEDREETDYFNTCCRLWLRLL